AAVLLAGVVAALRGAPLPFTGARPPLGIGLAGSTGPLDVAGTLLRAALALALPYARARGRWGAAVLAAAMLAASVLAVPGAAAIPLAVAAWALALALVARVR